MDVDATRATELDYFPQPSQVPSIERFDFQASAALRAGLVASELPRYSAIHAVPGEEVLSPGQEPDLLTSETPTPSDHLQTLPLIENDSNIPHRQVPSVTASEIVPANNSSERIFARCGTSSVIVYHSVCSKLETACSGGY